MEPNLDKRSGCDRCWPESADADWDARSGLQRRCELIHESHFHVTILACASCGQAYISVFSELTDWGGDDSRGWTLLPLTAAEEQTLAAAAPGFEERSLYEIGADRRSLYHMHPRGRDAESFWGRGIPMLPHD